MPPGYGVHPGAFAAANGINITTGTPEARGGDMLSWLGVPPMANAPSNQIVPHRVTEYTPPEDKSLPRVMKNAINMTIFVKSNGFELMLLPLVFTDALNFTWNTWEFNVTPVGIVPHEGVPRLVTSEKRAGSTSVLRRGIAFQMEADYFRTERGQAQFVSNCMGILACVNLTMAMDIMNEILNCKVQSATWQQLYGNTAVSYRAIIEKERDSYCPLIKSAAAFQILASNAMTAMTSRSPDTLIVPSGFKMYMGLVQPAEVAYSVAGPGGLAIKKSVQAIKSAALDSNIDVFECKPYMDGDGANPPVQLLEKASQVGEMYVMANEARASPSIATHKEPYTSDQRSVRIYDENADRFVTITLLQALRHCGAFSMRDERYSQFLVNFVRDARYNAAFWQKRVPASSTDATPLDQPPFPLATLAREGDRSSLKLMKVWGEAHRTNMEPGDFDHVAQTLVPDVFLTEDKRSGLDLMSSLMSEMDLVPFSKEFADLLLASFLENGLNEYGAIPLPTTRPVSVGLPPGYLSWAGLKTLAAEASKIDSKWRDVGIRAQAAVAAFESVVDHIRRLLPSSYIFDVPVENASWFGPQASSPAARLFNSLFYIKRLPLYARVNTSGGAAVAAAAAAAAAAEAGASSDADVAIIDSIIAHKDDAANFVPAQLSGAFFEGMVDTVFDGVDAAAVRRSAVTRSVLYMNIAQVAAFASAAAALKDRANGTSRVAALLLEELDARNAEPSTIVSVIQVLSENNISGGSVPEMISAASQVSPSRPVVANSSRTRKAVYEVANLTRASLDQVALLKTQSSGSRSSAAAAGASAGGQTAYTALPLSVTPAMVDGIYRSQGAYAVGNPDDKGESHYTGSKVGLSGSPYMANYEKLRSNLTAADAGGRTLEHSALDFSGISFEGAPASGGGGGGGGGGGASYDSYDRRSRPASLATIGRRGGFEDDDDEDDGLMRFGRAKRAKVSAIEPAGSDIDHNRVVLRIVNDWVRETCSFAGNGAATLVRRMAAMVFFFTPCDRFAVLDHMYKSNVYIPLNVILARPWIEHNVGSAVLMKRGSETGFTAYGQTNFMTSSDGVSKILLGNLTLNMKSAIIEPRNILIIDALMPKGYRGGNNTTFLDPENPDHRRSYRAANLSRPSIMSLLTNVREGSDTEPLPEFIDLFGKLPSPAANGQISGVGYSTATFYSYVYREALEASTTLAARGNVPYGDPNLHINSVLFHGHRYSYDKTTKDLKKVSFCNGHRGMNGSYPGAKAVWNGGDAMLRGVIDWNAY